MDNGAAFLETEVFSPVSELSSMESSTASIIRQSAGTRLY